LRLSNKENSGYDFTATTGGSATTDWNYYTTTAYPLSNVTGTKHIARPMTVWCESSRREPSHRFAAIPVALA
jgi:hypothetical protein